MANSNGRLWGWPCQTPARSGYTRLNAAAPQPSQGRSATRLRATDHCPRRVEAKGRSLKARSLSRPQIASGTIARAGNCSSSGIPGKTANSTGSSSRSSTGSNQIQRAGPNTNGTATTAAPQALRESVRYRAASCEISSSSTVGCFQLQRPHHCRPMLTATARSNGQLNANQAAATLA